MKFIIIEACNYKNFPVGGLLSFSRQLMSVYGNQIGLVGYGEANDPLGKWFKKNVDEVEYNYFAFDIKESKASKPIVPARISSYINVKRYKNEILSIGISSFFIQSHEILKVVSGWKVESICYRFPGVGNPIESSRYPFFRQFSKIFDKWFLPSILKADVVLAAADENSIKGLVERSQGILSEKEIHFFSTKVNTEIFHHVQKKTARENLNLCLDNQIFVTTGRLHHGKGWKFLLDVFEKYCLTQSNSKLIFVGDGEDRHLLESYIKEKKLEENIIVTGFLSPALVANYIQASDLFLLGSKKEGWSTSLIEALACYKPIVTTNVSSATSIVKNGINGYIVPLNDIDEFVRAIHKALNLQSFDDYVNCEIGKYELKSLKTNLGQIWVKAK